MSVNLFNHLLKSGASYAFSIHTCLRGALLNACPNNDIPPDPSPLMTYSCYCSALVTFLWFLASRMTLWKSPKVKNPV